MYSEPVVVSVFLAIMYCLYNSLMSINLKKECACTLHTLHKKKKIPVSFYLHKNLKFRLSAELIVSTCTPENEILPKKWINWSEEKLLLIAFP